MTQGPVLIVGAGHAGFQLAASLRQHGFAERICLFNDEAHLPYQRPPLSKAYLKGDGRPDSLMFRPDKFYRDQNIELIADRAVSIDRGARKLKLASGASLDYWHLVLATGARNRLLDIPNAGLEDVRYLRTLDESEALRKRIASGRRVVVIGAGFIGLEFAATARAKGLEVDVVELGARVMARAVTAEISEYFQLRHTRGRYPHPSRRAGDRHRGRRRPRHRGEPQRRPPSTGRSGRGRRRRPAQCRTGRRSRPEGGVGHHRRRAIADVGSPISPRSATARCSQALASAPRCGWSRCRTPPIRRAAWRRG